MALAPDELAIARVLGDRFVQLLRADLTAAEWCALRTDGDTPGLDAAAAHVARLWAQASSYAHGEEATAPG